MERTYIWRVHIWVSLIDHYKLHSISVKCVQNLIAFLPFLNVITKQENVQNRGQIYHLSASVHD